MCSEGLHGTRRLATLTCTLAIMAGPSLAAGQEARSVMQTLDDHVREDDVVVADTGYMASWASTLIEQKRAEASGKPALVDVVVFREVPAPTTRYDSVQPREL